MNFATRLLRAVATLSLIAGQAGAGEPSPSASNVAAKAGPDTLIRAINFALNGSDRINYTYADREKCIVVHSQESAQAGIKAVETFHLTNVDASRIAFQKMQSKSEFGVTYFTRVELHGEDVIRENGFAKGDGPYEQAFAFTDVELDLQTVEYDRLVRAWRYIYAHGCKSAKGSF